MKKISLVSLVLILGLFMIVSSGAMAQPLPGGTLDPLTVPKYVTPLVIPPVMNNNGAADNYDIAVRQFQQQILPGGIWNVVNGRADAFPATTVWSYGPAADPAPDASALGVPAGIAPAPNSQFNYPSYTIETMPTAPYGAGAPVSVRWINDLVDKNPLSPTFGNYLPHLLPLDQTLHWANPTNAGCKDPLKVPQTDCATNNPAPYLGPVPIVTHVHGAHIDPHSDGYPEAWWLPAANNIPLGYAMSGTLFDDATGINTGTLGYADYAYRQDQPATTLWYHDHSLGMTRSNVYAGPAGFWLIRGGTNDLTPGILPGPAPVSGEAVLALNIPGDPVRSAIREIPIAIQDRSFNADGSLFYPASRTFFDGYAGPYTGSLPTSTDIAPTWNPEAFFNTMVVNGVSWPTMEVAPALYRFRLLNGCNSRFLNLSMFEIVAETVKVKKGMNKAGQISTKTTYGIEIPFYQIGAEQGFLPDVVQIQTGVTTTFTVGGPVVTLAPNAQQALLMGLAERADVIVDFRGLPAGTRIRMINTAPDAPFGGFPDVPADPSTTGQVMEFVVTAGLNGASPTDPVLADGVTINPAAAVDPWLLALPAEAPLGATQIIREVSLNEEESAQVCVTVTPAGAIKVTAVSPVTLLPGVGVGSIGAFCAAQRPPSVPMAPVAAVLGTVDQTNPLMPLGVPLKWTANGVGVMKSVTVPSGTVNVWVTENPNVGAIEEWDIYNFTVDAHPIHMHLVRFEVLNRTPVPGIVPAPIPVPQQPWETGFKDTVIAYPGEITTVKAKFDVAGLYVWHCHIVEHEDNEMMRPYFVGP